MDFAAGICFVIAAVAELGGIGLLVQQAKVARQQLAGWEAANPERNADGSFGQLMLLNPVVTRVLAEQARPQRAVWLLGAGIVVGMVGNFLSM